jgi:putative ATPase
MDLFSAAGLSSETSPLSEILRPKNLDQIIGQERTIGAGSKLGQLLRKGYLPSLIIWGPPGTGKTTFALALGQHFNAYFVSINAVDSGAKQLREIGDQGRDRRLQYHQKTVLFVDEIHRFNKGQQDVLLPFVEKGDLVLLGATTENPSYELNRALLSRCRVVVFERLNLEDLKQIILKAEIYFNRSIDQILTNEALSSLFNYSDGDARRLINSLEIVYKFGIEEGFELLDVSDMQDLLQKNPLGYDKNSELHYDLISAFIKSVRGSDPDAAVYYLARMIDGGEDLVFIARRLIILASEDIGNADPRALSMAVAGLQAVEAVGAPEGAIILSQVTTYLSACPKSNASYVALNRAREAVEKTRTLQVPLHLRSARTDLAKSLGYGKDYKYPHDESIGWTHQEYRPAEVSGVRFYEPTQRGFEKNIGEYLTWMKGQKRDVKN